MKFNISKRAKILNKISTLLNKIAGDCEKCGGEVRGSLRLCDKCKEDLKKSLLSMRTKEETRSSIVEEYFGEVFNEFVSGLRGWSEYKLEKYMDQSHVTRKISKKNEKGEWVEIELHANTGRENSIYFKLSFAWVQLLTSEELAKKLRLYGRFVDLDIKGDLGKVVIEKFWNAKTPKELLKQANDVRIFLKRIAETL